MLNDWDAIADGVRRYCEEPPTIGEIIRRRYERESRIVRGHDAARLEDDGYENRHNDYTTFLEEMQGCAF